MALLILLILELRRRPLSTAGTYRLQACLFFLGVPVWLLSSHYYIALLHWYIGMLLLGVASDAAARARGVQINIGKVIGEVHLPTVTATDWGPDPDQVRRVAELMVQLETPRKL